MSMTTCPHLCCHAAPGDEHHHPQPAATCRFCDIRRTQVTVQALLDELEADKAARS